MSKHSPIASPVMAMLSRHSRSEIEGFISIAIDLLDLMDPDPELEEDDPSGQYDEDGVNTVTPEEGSRHFRGFGPGCPFTDVDIDESYRPLSHTIAGREEIRIRKARAASKRARGIDEVATAKRSVRKRMASVMAGRTTSP